MSKYYQIVQLPLKPLMLAALVAGISLTPLVFIGSHSVHAAGDASFSLSPSDGSYTVGNSLVISVSETSSSSDNTDAVQANLTYPSSLKYESTVLTGPFNLCGQNSGGNGSVSIGCASSSSENGSQDIAQITFSVIDNGTAEISMASGSNIVNASGSVWNGILPSANYTLNPVQTTPPPTPPPNGSGGGSSTGSSTGSGSGGSSSNTSSSNKSGTNTQSSPSTTSPATTTQTVGSSTSPKTPITSRANKGKSIDLSSALKASDQLHTTLVDFLLAPLLIIIVLASFLTYKGYRLSLVFKKPFIKLYKKVNKTL